jgi:hypothetical protein
MKKFSYICVLLLCIPEVNQAKEYHLADLGYVSIGSFILGTIMTGLYCSRNNAKYQYKTEQAIREQEIAAKEKKEKRDISHLIEKVTSLEKLFYQSKINSEQITNDPHEIFYHKVISWAGSVSAFKEELQAYEQTYDRLNPEDAKEHEAVILTIRKMRSQCNTNAYIKKAEKIELEETFKMREREAQIKKTESEARLTQNAEFCIQKTAECAQKLEAALTLLNRTQQKMFREIETLQSSQSTHAIEQQHHLANLKKDIAEQIGQSNKQMQQIVTMLKTFHQFEKPQPSAPPAAPVYPNYPPPNFSQYQFDNTTYLPAH